MPDLRHTVKHSRILAPIAYHLLYLARYIAAEWKGSPYSQEGEDLLVADYFKTHAPGAKHLYLDIGANHPIWLSNTYLLYKSGWHGITVEPIRQLCRLHRRKRPKDTCLEIGMGAKPGSFEFWEMQPHVYSTFDSNAASHVLQQPGVKLHAHHDVPVMTLAQVCEKYPEALETSFLSIDTEGLDLAVLQGADWTRFRPRLILCEANAAFAEDHSGSTGQFLAEKGYRVFKRTGMNVLFESTDA